MREGRPATLTLRTCGFKLLYRAVADDVDGNLRDIVELPSGQLDRARKSVCLSDRSFQACALSKKELEVVQNLSPE